jgi:hypothetical protein
VTNLAGTGGLTNHHMLWLNTPMAFGKRRRRHAIWLRIEELSIKAQPFAHIVDTEPPNSLPWKNAAVELCRVTKESLDLARALGDPPILDAAESAAGRVRTQCPAEAEKVGL